MVKHQYSYAKFWKQIFLNYFTTNFYNYFHKSCFKPLLKEKHNRVSNGIRLVGDNWGVEFSNLVGKYLYITCRLEINWKKVLVSPPVQKDAKCLKQLDGCASEDDILCSDDQEFRVDRCRIHIFQPNLKIPLDYLKLNDHVYELVQGKYAAWVNKCSSARLHYFYNYSWTKSVSIFFSMEFNS